MIRARSKSADRLNMYYVNLVRMSYVLHFTKIKELPKQKNTREALSNWLTEAERKRQSFIHTNFYYEL